MTYAEDIRRIVQETNETTSTMGLIQIYLDK